MAYYIYILASQRNGTLYIGVTNDLIRRVWAHRNHVVDGFSKKYNVHLLVHFAELADPRSAIQYEKKLKHWTRKWTLALIEKTNPDWRDLYEEITAG